MEPPGSDAAIGPNCLTLVPIVAAAIDCALMAHSREEVGAAIERYIAVRDEINAGQRTWRDLAQFFTDDAVFSEAMEGLDDWKFPTDFYAIDGDQVVVKWRQVLPGRRADGTAFVQSGYSTLVYAGDGKFCYEEDLLNMMHVFEDMRASGWTPPANMGMPPKQPDRDFSRPDRG
jgi:hypothetical protein